MTDWQVPFLERLGVRVPVLRQRVATYLADPNGEPSAHGFVAHMAREMGAVPGAWPVAAVRELLDFLESEQGVDDRIDDLIEMRFIEVVVDHGVEVRDLLGPKLATEFERYTLGYVVGGPEDLFVRRLLEALPFFQADWDREHDFYEEHKSEGFFSPPSPSSFMIDLASTAVHRYRTGGVEEADQLRALFGFMESEVGDPDLERPIVTFVECLPEPDRGDDAVLDMLGPWLRSLKFEQVRRDDESASESVAQFLYRMADAVPLLRGKLQEHFRDYRRPLGHAFMGQVVFEVFELYASGRAEDVRVLLEFLEVEFGVDQDVDNVIAVSFVEMLPSPGERGADIEDALGPKLRGELERQRAWSEDRIRELASARVVPPPDGLDVGGGGEDR